MIRRLCLIAAMLVTATAARAADPTVQHLQAVSVTIKSGSSQGSGVMFTRGETTYVWTAAHVVDNLRKIRMVIINGSPKAVVEFSDAEIVQEFRENGRRIGETKMDARVIRYSDSEEGHDLALLEVRKRNFTAATASFYDGEEIPAIGTELYHVGSLLGQFGSNSLTTGVVSQIGRVLDLGANGVTFDQVSTPGFPGSSGGGVFEKSTGRYVGMLVRGAGENFCLIVPVRRMREWADSAGIAWAMDPSVAMPTAEELAKLPIEDAGVEFDAERESSEAHDAINREYPFLLRVEAADAPAVLPTRERWFDLF